MENTKNKYRNFIISVCISAIITCALFFSVNISDTNHETAKYIILISIFICLLNLIYLCLNNHIYAPSMFLYLYFSIFFLIPCLFQLSDDHFPWGKGSYDTQTLSKSALIILIFITFVSIGRMINIQHKSFKFKTRIINSEKLRRYYINIFYLLLSSIIGLITIYVFGIDNFIGSRGGVSAIISKDMNLTQSGLLLSLPKMLSIVSLFISIYVIYRRVVFQKKALINITNFYILFVTVPIYLILNFPGAQSRMAFFGTLIVVLMICFSFRNYISKSIAIIVLCAGVLTIFPISQSLNRGGEFNTDIEFPNFISYMKNGDFDGFQTTTNAIIYAERHGYKYGNQILSALLFFIPRSVWTGKSQHAGEVTGQFLGYKYTNISTPIVGEIYLDFGIIGVIFGGIIIGIIYKYADTMYDAAVGLGGVTLYRILLALFAVSTIFLMRGSLLGIFAGVAVKLGIIYGLIILPNILIFFIRVNPSAPAR